MGAGCNAMTCGPVPTILASGEAIPYGIAVNATSVYWATDNTIRKTSINGGAVTTFNNSPAGAWYIVLDATNAYWSTGNGIMRAPLAGGMPSVLTLIPNWSSYGIAINGGFIFWTNDSAHTVMKVPIIGGAAMQLAAVGGNAYGLDVDATNVYWLGSGLKKASVNGGAIMVLANTGGIHVAVDGSNAYWANYGSGQVFKCALSACVPMLVIDKQNYPEVVVVDATHIYWTTRGTVPAFKDGTIMKAPIAGGDVVQLASAQARPLGLAVDASSVYWTSDNGTIKKAPK